MTDCCGDGDILTIHPRINEVNRRVHRLVIVIIIIIIIVIRLRTRLVAVFGRRLNIYANINKLHQVVFKHCPAAAGMRVGKILCQNQYSIYDYLLYINNIIIAYGYIIMTHINTIRPYCTNKNIFGKRA